MIEQRQFAYDTINSERMSSLVDKFITVHDVKESSKITYRKCLKQFMTWIAKKGEANPIRETILQYKAYLEEKGLTALTLSIYIVAVRQLFEWLGEENIYPNIASGIKGAKRPRGFRKDTLTIDQVKKLLSSSDRSTLMGKRDYAILNLLVRTGLRTIEVIRANMEDIRQEGGESILWVKGKGADSKDDFVLLMSETKNALMEYLNARGKVKEKYPLFASISNRNNGGRLTTKSISRIVKEHLRGVGIESTRITAHSLRHTFATLALIGGAPIVQVKEAMGHKSIDTTMIYAHLLNRIKNGAERYIAI